MTATEESIKHILKSAIDSQTGVFQFSYATAELLAFLEQECQRREEIARMDERYRGWVSVEKMDAIALWFIKTCRDMNATNTTFKQDGVHYLHEQLGDWEIVVTQVRPPTTLKTD